MIKFNDSTSKRDITEVKLLGDKDFVDVARESLNEVAIFAKKTTIQRSANESFTVRNKTFFKAMTAVDYSKRGQSNTLSGLYSRVGMANNSKKPRLSSGYSPLKNMEQQEHGGTVKRKITPLNKSRIAQSYSRPVSRSSFFDKNIIVQSEMKGVQPRGMRYGLNKKQRFRIALEMARKEGQKFILGDEYRAIYSVRNKNIKRIFGYDKSNQNKLKATHFMEHASRNAVELLPAFFIQQAIKKIEFRASRIKY